MYKISVPIMIHTLYRSDLDKVVSELKRLDAERVLLAMRVFKSRKERDDELANLEKYCQFFKEQGFEVGAWLWTFWYEGEESFTHMRYIKGDDDRVEICPSDQGYRKHVADELKKIAECGVDLILFDDDFRYTFLAYGFACVCENHLKKISDDMGEVVTREILEEKLLYGKANPYRDAWLNANGYFMELFAKEMREAVDSVRPDVRLGRCSCMGICDMDGTDAVNVGRLLAGNTKPFIRLTGAPYWAVNKDFGNRIQDTIEYSRLLNSWTANDFEIIAEGDCYPRPRCNCPAAYLEGFDAAIRADGLHDGILKYALDYCSSIEYETGYAERHELNKPIYSKLEEKFSHKPAVGIRVYEAMKKYAQTDIPKRCEGKYAIQDYTFSSAARMLAAAAIPTVYEGSGICGIVFGENARSLPCEAFDKGLILDYTAAKIISEKGIDVGISHFGDEVMITTEYHCEEKEYANIVWDLAVNKVTLNENAKLDSEFLLDEGKIPASYFYENANAQKFFVFCFDTYFIPDHIIRSYMRGIQIAKAAVWLSGQALPAVCHKNPDLYMMCKEQDGELCIGLWNFSIDSILKPEITLSKEYTDIEFINCTGKLCGNKVTLSEISPFAFAGICVK